MRVLVAAFPQSGHVRPLLPLVAALRARGDDVLMATGPEFAEAVADTGAAFTPTAGSEDQWFERLRQRTRGNPGDGLAPERINHYFFPRVFAEIAADDMVDGLLAAGREFGPDLVLFEGHTLAGPLVADLLGVPGVQHLVGPLYAPEVYALADDAVAPLWRSFDRHSPGHAGLFEHLTIEVCPPSLRVHRVPTGATTALRPAPLPERPAGGRSRPLVYVTFGTFFNYHAGVFRTALDGLGDLPVDVVVTTGRESVRADLGPSPANVQIERYIPQGDLLPDCAAIVHHGGSGTTFGALAHGVPQVVVPQGADNFDNADACVRAGVGVALYPDRYSPAAVAEAVTRVIEEGSFRTAAGQVAEEVAAMPGPDEVAAELAQIAGQPRVAVDHR